MTPLERAYREERAAVLASVARRIGDLGVAEDAVQEAFVAAATRWPADGVPERPGAWLTTTAWRKALDAIRRQRVSVPLASDADRPGQLGAGPAATPAEPEPGGLNGPGAEDDVLALVLTCCHPALAIEAQVALCLRHVAGLSTQEIARAFLVPHATMLKRLVRARNKIRVARIPFALPDRRELPGRVAAVHRVLYLVFNEGYLSSGEGPAVRQELCDEAIWLARQVHRLIPDDEEARGLLALMLVLDARRAARQDSRGDLVPFPAQNRDLWNRAAVDEARALLSRTVASPPGPYRLQAAIALLHTVEGERVDWPRIARLYEALVRVDPSPAVAVNRAVAVGRADGPRAGLAVLAPLLADPAMAEYLPLRAAHADLLEGAEDPSAAAAWRAAADLAPAGPQRNALLGRAADRRGRGLAGAAEPGPA